MSLVQVQNKLPQTVEISVVNDTDPNQIDSVKLKPRGRLPAAVENTRITEYTESLARRGYVTIVPISG